MNEATVRDLLKQGIALGERIAAISPNLIDDKVLSVAKLVVEEDAYWSIAWRVIDKVMGYVDPDNQLLVMGNDPDASLVAQEAGIDPATIVVIIQAIIEILNWWRNR